MATETDARPVRRTPSVTAVGASGVVSGLVGGAIMGILLAVLVSPFLLEMVPALYDLQGGLAGWFAHAVHSGFFGALFALLAVESPLNRYAADLGRIALLGLGWGILLWIVATGIVMPVWLGLTHFPDTPLVPYLRPSLFLAHLAYGATVGVLLGLFVSIAD